MSNTIIFQEDWEVKLQERLAEPNKWKSICRVKYTNTKVLHNPYMSDAAVQSGTRGTAYSYQDITITDQSVTIDTFKILPQLIDRADLAQSTYADQMELAESQGVLIDEAIETAMLAEHAQWTNFGDLGGGALGLGAGAITVSMGNIDDIIRGIKREIRKAKGQKLLGRYGGFIVWRPEDFELLEAYVQANGFSTADNALKEGVDEGFRYMGMDHWASNSYTAGHVFAGVKNLFSLGICTATYGKVVVVDEPATADGAVSGIGIVSRADFKFKAWFKTAPVLFDVNVA
jgi:hypothetical protein